MNVLILGGNSARHKEWVRQVADAVRPHVEKVVYLDYQNWDQGGNADVERELERARQLAATLGAQYVIISKSVGTIITLVGINRGLLAPVRCVLLGVPMGIVKDYPEVGTGFSKLPPTALVQNDADPYGSYEDVHAYAANFVNQNLSFITGPGATHDYVDFNQIVQLATSV